MLAIIGLGNTGEKQSEKSYYEHNRHNIGFLVLDSIARHYNFSNFTGKDRYEVSTNNINNIKTLLIKPVPYMNNSGVGVQRATNFYKITEDNIVVIHDDLDLPFLNVRYKTNSGDGGQRGVRDIHEKIGKNIHRIKIGINRPLGNTPVEKWVLSDFNKNELAELSIFLELFNRNINLLMNKDFNNFCKEVNQNMEQ